MIQSPRNEPSSSAELLSSSACQSQRTLRGDAFTLLPLLLVPWQSQRGDLFGLFHFDFFPRQKKICFLCVPFSQYSEEEGRCMRNEAAAEQKKKKSGNYLPVGQISARISARKLSARSKCTSSQVAPAQPSTAFLLKATRECVMRCVIVAMMRFSPDVDPLL